MADKLTDRTLLATQTANDDLVHLVDVSDTTQDPEGSSYKAKRSQIATQTFADAAARAAAVPGFVGQVGVQLDTFMDYVAIGTGAGQWVTNKDVWTTPAFNASHYTGTGGTWTVASGDVILFKYKQMGKVLFVKCELYATTIATAPSALNIDINAMTGLTLVEMGVVSGGSNLAMYNNAGTQEVIALYNTSTSIGMKRLFPPNDFADGTDNQDIGFSVVLEIA